MAPRNLALLTLLSAMYMPLAWSEGACPEGQRMVGQQNTPGAVLPICQPIPGYNSSPPQQRVEWADRWGAIAFDGKAGAAGTVANQENRSKAEQMALADCAKGGARNCEIIYAYRNQCAAVASSSTESGYARSPTLDDAQAEAVKACARDSHNPCKVVYSACSLPVRVR